MSSTESAFTVYHAGVALKLKWSTSTPTPTQQQQILRICALSRDLLFLLTTDHCLYSATHDVKQTCLYLEMQRTAVQDVGYCRRTQQLFIVTTAGTVLMQQLSIANAQKYCPTAWQTISFDPLELNEDGVLIQRICCSAQGVVFVTRRGEIYVLGSCGDVFAAEMLPKRMRLFDEYKQIADLVAGDEYFVTLLRRVYDDKTDPMELLVKKAPNHAGSQPPPIFNRQQTQELDLSFDDAERKQELNSNSSVRSYSSKSSDSHAAQDFDGNVRQMLKQGYALLHMQVYTFGGVNNGLLGTGDHIKRSVVSNLQKLDSIGVCSIAAGREHTVARTLDGRLFHWGLNTQQQLNGKTTLSDLSSPTEFKLDNVALNAQQRDILAACCGDYQTVLLNANGALHTKDKPLQAYQQDFLTLQMCAVSRDTAIPLLLAADDYTVHNHRQFQLQYHNCYSNLQTQLRQLLHFQHAVHMLQLFPQRNPAAAPKLLQHVCRAYQKMLYLLAAALHSLERYYRGDFDNVADINFIKYHRECIELFEEYTKAYCDIYSIDGYAEAARVFAHFTSAPLMPDQRGDEVADVARIFQQPFQIFPNFVQFLEQLCKSQQEYGEHLLAWQAFVRQNRIDLELAENTQEFWQRNERVVKIRHFRRKYRRVILTSAAVPLKLANNAMSMSTTTFILFSDCLCQVGSQLHTYPLVAMWLKIENDTSLRVITPERNFTLIARTHHDKMLWYDQLVSSIMTALGRPQGTKISNVRTTGYVFSRNHAKYAGVHAYGRWRNGLLHGNCFLEYPDGKYYFGEMQHGQIEGYGKMVIPSVGIYEGTFKAGKFHGHGTYEMKDNEIYEGNFRDGQFHGHGMLRSNNYTYVGEYQAHAKCGYGILDDMLSGDKYMGMFAVNKRTGAGTCITMNGDYFEGIFVNDELIGSGIAVFENDYYYEGELTMQGPCGKGTYYMPNGSSVDAEDYGINDDDADFSKRQLVGNVLSGQLNGEWQDVRVVAGNVKINRQFPKYPSTIGSLVVDNNRKWRALFENFEEEILGTVFTTTKTTENAAQTTKHIWSRIAVYMTTQREREKALEQQDTAYSSTHSYFARNISLGFANSNSFDKISLKSTSSLLPTAKSSILDLSSGLTHADPRRAHSQETLYDADADADDVTADFMNYYNLSNTHNEEHSFNSLLNASLGSWANDSNTASTRSSLDSVLNLSGGLNNNSFSSQNGLEFVPSFGITTLTELDVAAIKEYLVQAFKDRHHPLHVLNQRIANCFYTSYGCWKVKPTPLLAKQAMREWESISKRVYKFVRKMFPALPEEYCVLESAREVVSHITLLYPIVLSEGIYSTLFVLYANKYSRKDELYRQNLLYADKMKDHELAEQLSLESTFLPIVRHSSFAAAIQSLKQLQEKYSPKAMLTVIENCMQQITDAHKLVENENSVILAADSMMPLTLFLVLRAAVPHLGAELALLDDLTGGANFQFEMNGIAGYCYTTLKACYEHITAKVLNKTT